MTALAIAAVCIPVGTALAPEAVGDLGSQPAQAVDPFPASTQLATRTIADADLDELSGMAASRRFPGVLYGVNDSANAPIVYAIDAEGKTVARLRLEGIENTDWEALAPCSDANGDPVLWIGDIGDNYDSREHVRIIRIAEPGALADQNVAWQEYWLSYPDGPHNAEALMCNPKDNTLTLATKNMDGEGVLYSLPAELSTGRDNQVQPIGKVPQSVTDGAWELAPDGDPRLVLIDYWRIHRQDADGQWKSRLGPLQVQREALAWPWLSPGTANDEVLVGTEGLNSKILAATVP